MADDDAAQSLSKLLWPEGDRTKPKIKGNYDWLRAWIEQPALNGLPVQKLLDHPDLPPRSTSQNTPPKNPNEEELRCLQVLQTTDIPPDKVDDVVAGYFDDPQKVKKVKQGNRQVDGNHDLARRG